MSAADHAFAIELVSVIPLVGGRNLREPLPDVVQRLVSTPVRSIRLIRPTSRWPQLLHASVQAMKPQHRRSDPLPTYEEICALTEAIEAHLGTARTAAQVELVPESYYANPLEHYVLFSQSHAALLELAATD
ncbi:hypothetical protein ACL02S_10695 [Nocardia sp. 004]|uniref:hypothetical protein n=1 Tax=Nocardia sp. 004 TaxID=3385978 RepID=UPI0039A18FB6